MPWPSLRRKCRTGKATRSSGFGSSADDTTGTGPSSPTRPSLPHVVPLTAWTCSTRAAARAIWRRELWPGEPGQVTGADRSPPLIAAAREAAAGLPAARFHEADLAELPFADASFNLVVVNHVFNDLPDITGPVGELARVLRPGGRLVILTLHPCFYGRRAERQAIRRSLPAADYFAPRVIEQRFEVDGISSPDPTVTWVRPLEAYTEAITSNGLCITGLTGATSHGRTARRQPMVA